MQNDGSKQVVILKDVQYVQDLANNLFRVTKSLDNGWTISNKGIMVSLQKGKTKITFDKIFRTNYGVIFGIEMNMIEDHAFTSIESGVSIEINKLHRLLAHPSEETLRLTARQYGVHLKGEFRHFFHFVHPHVHAVANRNQPLEISF